MEDKFLQAKKLIDKAQKILLISHKRPDGDTLGASSAFYQAFLNMGKEPTMACIDEPSERFHFVVGVNRIIHAFDFRSYDLIIVSDAGASYMTRYHEIYPDIFKGDVPVINFDHHASNDNFGVCNIVDPYSASTTLLQYRFFTFLNIPITPSMATAMLTGIYNDTGSLMHSNTSLEVFETTSKLVELGGKVHQVAKNLFRTTPISTLKLWGKVLENVRVNDEGVTLSVITWKEFEECGATSDEISGVVDFLNSVPHAKYACLLHEEKNGNIKGSFRTQREDVDLTKVAGQFGGGGHKKAAGFSMPGRLQKEVHWKIVPRSNVSSVFPLASSQEETAPMASMLK